MKRREIDAKLDEIVKFSEIEKFLDTPVKRYSSGMYVRLAFAVAAHMDTEILLIDEVLAVGDAQFQKKCLGKMGDVATKEGRTVLFVSHNMAAIRMLCNSGIFLEEGRVAEQGTIADVTDSYLRSGADDLSWERNNTPQKDAYFEKVYFVDESGVILKEISPVGTVYLVIEFVLRRDIKNVKIAVNLKNRINDYICSSSPEDCNIFIPTEKGRYRATLRFPNNYLLFQNYCLEFSLYIPTKNALDFITAINFSVKEIPSWSYCTEGRVGYLAIPSEWNITKINNTSQNMSINVSNSFD